MKRRTQTARLGVLFLILVFAVCSIFVWLTYHTVRQGQLNAALIAAIKQGRTNMVLSLLDAGADPNATNHADIPVSFWQQFTLPFRRLFGQPLPQPPVKGESALFLAIYAPKLQPAIVLALLNKGADAHAQDRDGDTALIALFAGPPLPDDPSDAGDAGPSVLSVGPAEQPLLVKALLERGVAINAIGVGHNACYGYTALMVASLCGWTKSVGFLLAKRADPNVVVSGGDPGTALSLAAMGERADIVKMLLASGADVNLADCTGSTPLHYARTSRPILQLLKAAGAREKPQPQ